MTPIHAADSSGPGGSAESYGPTCATIGLDAPGPRHVRLVHDVRVALGAHRDARRQARLLRERLDLTEDAGRGARRAMIPPVEFTPELERPGAGGVDGPQSPASAAR